MPAKKLPFTVESLLKKKKEYHRIVVTEEMLRVMTGIKHPEQETSALEKLYNALEMYQGNPVIKLLKRYGSTVAEDEAIREIANNRDEALLAYRTLLAEIAEELELELDLVYPMVANLWGNQGNPVIHRRTQDIIKVNRKLNSTDSRKAEVTISLQSRTAIEGWTEEDTLALNSILFEQLYEYCQQDRNGWVADPKLEIENLSVSNNSGNSSKQIESESSNQKALAGTTST